MGQMVRRVPPNVFLIRAPRLAGMIATTTSVPGKRANNSPAGKSSLQVATRFTKGCVGERPAAKTAAKERAPTNPQKHDHTPTVHAHHSHPTTTEKPITPSPRSPCAPTTLAARDSFRDLSLIFLSCRYLRRSSPRPNHSSALPKSSSGVPRRSSRAQLERLSLSPTLTGQQLTTMSRESFFQLGRFASPSNCYNEGSSPPGASGHDGYRLRIPRRDSSYSPFLYAPRVFQDAERQRGRSISACRCNRSIP